MNLLGATLFVIAAQSVQSLADSKVEVIYNETDYPIIYAEGASFSLLFQEGLDPRQVSTGWKYLPARSSQGILKTQTKLKTAQGRDYSPKYEYIVFQVYIAKKRLILENPILEEEQKNLFLIRNSPSAPPFTFDIPFGQRSEFAKARQSEDVAFMKFYKKARFQPKGKPDEMHFGLKGSEEARAIENFALDQLPFGGAFITVENKTGRHQEFSVGGKFQFAPAGVQLADSKNIENARSATWQIDRSINTAPQVTRASDGNYNLTVESTDAAGLHSAIGFKSGINQKLVREFWYKLGDGKKYVNYIITIK